MKCLFAAIVAVLLCKTASTSKLTYIVDPGPTVVPTIGHPWPLPQNWTQMDGYFTINPGQFTFRIVDNTCDIVQEAVARYKRIIFQNKSARLSNRGSPTLEMRDRDFTGPITELSINLQNECEKKPHLNMDEEYQLDIDRNPLLISNSVWGILRGLETFSQLVAFVDGQYRINATQIKDAPRFPHRGLLVDTARHYISPAILEKILTGMSYNKLNVFHWHIVDDQSFPYESMTYPELSKKGSYHKDLVYSQETVKNIIEFARMRGIRVMVEIDTPGHTRSWGVSHINLLTPCFDKFDGKFGPLDPTKNFTYEFVGNLLREMAKVFPDEFLHLGADEVDYQCWDTNPAIKRYMKAKNYTSYDQLQSEYIEKLLKIVNKINITSVVWQEAFQSNLTLRPDTIVHVWKDDRAKEVMFNATKAGYRVLLSSGWYLDHLKFQADFPDMYANEPIDFGGSVKQQELVIGGEACMWSEMVDDNSILTRIFPRVGAAAERLWSHTFNKDITYAKQRIEEHACRLKRRHIPTQPAIGASFCIV